MFTMDEVLSKENQREALEHFKMKKNGCGPDKMPLSELENYWALNHEAIEENLRNGTYQPGIIESFEIVNGRGKRRVVSSFNVIDRFISRLLAQKLISKPGTQ